MTEVQCTATKLFLLKIGKPGTSPSQYTLFCLFPPELSAIQSEQDTAIACQCTDVTNAAPKPKRVVGNVNSSVSRRNMVRSCSAVGCANKDTKENRARAIIFYRIPVNLEKPRRLWLAAIGTKDFDPSSDPSGTRCSYSVATFTSSEVSACRNTNGIAVVS